MSSLIPRYGEFNAETLNTSFAALQARYELGGNALENIVSGTLTASTATIDLPFTAGAYQYLRLVTDLKTNGISISCLRANRDASTVYGFTLLEGDGASPSVFPLNSVDYMFLYSDTTDPLSEDVWIFLNPTGFNLIGSALSHIGANTLNVRVGGVYRGGAVTSLQLTFQSPVSGGLYLADTSYLLQGLPI